MLSVSVRRQALELLVKLLEAYSPTFQEERAVRVLEEELRKLGYDSVRVDSVGNLVAEKGSGDYTILLAGHIDTVAGYIPVRVEEGRVYGRGAVDAKGPLAAMAVAGALAGESLEDARVVFAALVGEEGPSHGAHHLVESGFRADAIIVGEPTGLDGIAIGCRGSGRLVVECRSTGGHSASPQIYASACEDLIEIWLHARSRAPGDYTLTLLRLECGEDSFNVLPRYGRMTIGVRVPVGGSLDDVLRVLQEKTGERCKYTVDSYVKPFRGKPGNPVARSLARALARRGVKPRFVVKQGTSDMVILAGITESIAEYGPGDPALSHTDVEWIDVEEFYAGIEVYREAVLELARMERLKYVGR